jgi:hypothetical protein
LYTFSPRLRRYENDHHHHHRRHYYYRALSGGLVRSQKLRTQKTRHQAGFLFPAWLR